MSDNMTKQKQDRTDDILVWIHGRVSKIANQIELALESPTPDSNRLRRALRSLRILESQLPPCSPAKFADLLDSVFSRGKQ